MEHVTDTIQYVGCEDPEIKLFESQYPIEHGVTYNSYIIRGENAIAVMDTVDQRKGSEWLENVRTALNGQTPTYLIVQHLEPDHSALVDAFLNEYPQTTIVASKKAVDMMPNFFDHDMSQNCLIVKDNDTLDLGGRTLTFFTAPMVHWPEVILTYDSKDKVLFSADGFGRFGPSNSDYPWEDEAARYYLNIVGKFGPQVQNALKKLGNVEIEIIAPLHGPVLKENLGYYIGKYNKWSTYTPDKEGVLVCVSSIHGNTNKVAQKVKEILEQEGCSEVKLIDLTREDRSEAVSNAFRYPKMVLLASSYDTGVLPSMEQFLNSLHHKNYKNRTVALVENASWAPCAARIMKSMLEQDKDVTIVDPMVTIWTRLKDSDLPALNQMCKALLEA